MLMVDLTEYVIVPPPKKKNVELIGQQYPAGIYLIKVNNGNTRTICEICLKLTITTSE